MFLLLGGLPVCILLGWCIADLALAWFFHLVDLSLSAEKKSPVFVLLMLLCIGILLLYISGGSALLTRSGEVI